jgi:hypothetical protein
MKAIRYWLVKKLLGRDTGLDNLAAETYEDIWPKHNHYAETNKRIIRLALWKARYSHL